MEHAIIGIDLGGTHLRIGAVASDNEMKSPVVIDSAVIADAEHPLEALCGVIEAYRGENHLRSVEAISIGVPSSVANDKETVICTTNIRDRNGRAVFSNQNIAAALRTRFAVPVCVNNDVNNILQYDIAANRLEKRRIVVGIYIGTGVGASVVIDGRALEGKDGAALDLGHIPYFGADAPCSCGKRGCCECYASGWKLQQIRAAHYPDTRIEDLFTLHRNEPPLQSFIAACAHVFALMATIFNPDAIVAGGGVLEMKDFPRRAFERAVNENVGADVMRYGFDYVYSRSFVGKGVVGAAVFARQHLLAGA